MGTVVRLKDGAFHGENPKKEISYQPEARAGNENEVGPSN